MGIGVEDAVEVRPVDGPEAHGAGFATGVKGAAVELVGLELAAGSADGKDFGVGGWVEVRGDSVGSGCDDFAITHDDGAEWAAEAAGSVFCG